MVMMSYRIAIVGIDGSGKSTVARALADLAAAEIGVTTAAVGDDVRCKTPEEDLLMPGFAPDGLPAAARLGHWFRRLAKASVNRRLFYPPLKLVHLVLQERTVRCIEARYRPDVIFCDGNLLLSSAGRAVNYIDPETDASDPFVSIRALYEFVMHGEPLPDATAQRIPGLRLMRYLRLLDERLQLRLMQLPDALIFLDVDPAVALARLRAKGGRLDRHENIQDMTQARTMYHRTAQFFGRQRGAASLAIIDTTDLSLGQTLRDALRFADDLCHHKEAPEVGGRVLGSADEGLSKIWGVAKKALSYQYLVRCVLLNLHRGNARQLTFPLSRLGRLSLREGYSANVMQAIYLRDSQRYGLLDRLFLDYSLHRAVYHRLSILTRVVEHEFRHRLEQMSPGMPVKVLTVPSGYAFDLLQPLERIARVTRAEMQRIHILASDLDPSGCIERELTRSARALGVDLRFLRGDLASDEMRDRFQRSGPFDVVLFVGLSYWIPKTHLMRFLRLVRDRLLASGGVLFSDCFTQDAYALSGKQMGYKNNFYSPQDYASLLAYCGFESDDIHWKSGPERINHVFVARVPCSPRRQSALRVTTKHASQPVAVPRNMARTRGAGIL